MTHIELLELYFKYIEIMSYDVDEKDEAFFNGQKYAVKFLINLLKKPEKIQHLINIVNIVN